MLFIKKNKVVLCYFNHMLMDLSTKLSLEISNSFVFIELR